MLLYYLPHNPVQCLLNCSYNYGTAYRAPLIAQCSHNFYLWVWNRPCQSVHNTITNKVIVVLLNSRGKVVNWSIPVTITLPALTPSHTQCRHVHFITPQQLIIIIHTYCHWEKCYVKTELYICNWYVVRTSVVRGIRCDGPSYVLSSYRSVIKSELMSVDLPKPLWPEDTQIKVMTALQLKSPVCIP